MGVMKEMSTGRKPATKPASPQSPYGGTQSGASYERLGWDALNAMLVVETIAAVNRAGDGISFATGARGRWLSVTILCGDGNSTLRAFSMDEAEELLQEVLKTATARAK